MSKPSPDPRYTRLGYQHWRNAGDQRLRGIKPPAFDPKRVEQLTAELKARGVLA